MQDTVLTLEYLDKEVMCEDLLNRAIIVEDIGKENCIYKLTLTGKYEREYIVITYLMSLNYNTVLLDKDILLVCLFHQVCVIDIKQDKLIKTIDLGDMGQIFGVYKFKSGYFVHHEEINCFYNKKFEKVWEAGCVDIFVNPKVKNNLEIYDDYIAVYDWYGNKHFYNEDGEFKTEYHPEYDDK